jgi:hypothetical protein
MSTTTPDRNGFAVLLAARCRAGSRVSGNQSGGSSSSASRPGGKECIPILTGGISGRPGTAGRDPQLILFQIPVDTDRPARVEISQGVTASGKNHRRVPVGFKNRPIPANSHKNTATLPILSV